MTSWDHEWSGLKATQRMANVRCGRQQSMRRVKIGFTCCLTMADKPAPSNDWPDPVLEGVEAQQEFLSLQPNGALSSAYDPVMVKRETSHHGRTKRPGRVHCSADVIDGESRKGVDAT